MASKSFKITNFLVCGERTELRPFEVGDFDLLPTPFAIEKIEFSPSNPTSEKIIASFLIETVIYQK